MVNVTLPCIALSALGLSAAELEELHKRGILANQATLSNQAYMSLACLVNRCDVKVFTLVRTVQLLTLASALTFGRVNADQLFISLGE